MTLVGNYINLAAASSLQETNFVSLTDLYSPRLRKIARGADPGPPEGIYVRFPGSHYGTPVGVRMIKALGAGLMGMSTAFEATTTRMAGMGALGISLVTNRAAGAAPSAFGHGEVPEAGKAAGPRIS